MQVYENSARTKSLGPGGFPLQTFRMQYLSAGFAETMHVERYVQRYQEALP